MSDSILVRVTLDAYDFAHPSEKQTQVYAQIPDVARVSYVLPGSRYEGLRNRAWPEVLDVAQEHYEQGWTVSAPATAVARQAVMEWLRDDANRDEMQAAWEQDQARRHPVARKLLARIAELEADLAAKAQDAEAAVKGWERARARVAKLETQTRATRSSVITEVAEKTDARCLEYGVFGVGDFIRRLAQQATTEDPCHPCGCPKRFDRHADGCPTEPTVPTSYPPALPWARLMDHEDLTEFLDELAASAITHAPAETALTEVEATCGRWRLIAEAQHAHNTAPGPDTETDGAE